MNLATRGRGRDRGAPSSDTLAAVKNQITVVTSGYGDGYGGLRVDWDELSADERRELVALTQEADDEDGFSLTRLGRKLRRWEALVEKATGADGLFSESREWAEIKRQVAELHRETARLPISRKEEKGLLAELGEQVRGGYLHGDHVALLALLLVAFESGLPLGRGRFEGSGANAVLAIDANMGLISEAMDDNGVFVRWRQILEHLERNAWVAVERNGPAWRIRLATRAKGAMSVGAP